MMALGDECQKSFRRQGVLHQLISRKKVKKMQKQSSAFCCHLLFNVMLSERLFFDPASAGRREYIAGVPVVGRRFDIRQKADQLAV